MVGGGNRCWWGLCLRGGRGLSVLRFLSSAGVVFRGTTQFRGWWFSVCRSFQAEAGGRRLSVSKFPLTSVLESLCVISRESESSVYMMRGTFGCGPLSSGGARPRSSGGIGRSLCMLCLGYPCLVSISSGSFVSSVEPTLWTVGLYGRLTLNALVGGLPFFFDALTCLRGVSLKSGAYSDAGPVPV